jgi:hypothetical protein
MRLIIEARLEGEQTSAMAVDATIVAVMERRDRSVAGLGLTLAEGRALLAEVQSTLVLKQTAGWMASEAACRRCGSVLAHKDRRSIVMRTVFGKVVVPSPRLWECRCLGKPCEPRRSLSPLCKAVPKRVTPELEYLQAKWAAHLPYRQATDCFGRSFRWTRRSPWAALDAESSPSATHSTRRSSAILPPDPSSSTAIRFANRSASAV